jgi:hypothetical protein
MHRISGRTSRGVSVRLREGYIDSAVGEPLLLALEGGEHGGDGVDAVRGGVEAGDGFALVVFGPVWFGMVAE